MQNLYLSNMECKTVIQPIHLYLSDSRLRYKQTPLILTLLAIDRLLANYPSLPLHAFNYLAFAVNLLSRSNSTPQMAHLQAAKQILRYVRRTTSQGLFYPRFDTFTLIGYSDADWGGDLDQRKSTGAYIFTINNTPVTWNTKKQTCIALSSTESESRSLVKATKEAKWIQILF